MKLSTLLLTSLLFAGVSLAADPVKPLKILIVAGGCCHDYAHQPDILKAGIEARANATVETAYSPDKSTKVRFPMYESADWAKGYDVIIHDECAADVKDHPYVDNIVNAHKNGVPAVNLHCAMHCYRVAANINQPTEAGSPDALWFEYLGLQSAHHGKQLPIELTVTDTKHPITVGTGNWTTMNEELYNNVKVFPTAHALIQGKQAPADKPGENDNVVAWTNEYGPNKTRIFSTTVGHNNATVGDDKYLELITRGVLWAAGKLGDDGKPVAGYAAVKK